MLIPAFQLQLDDGIQDATVGKYDGKHPTLTCATSTGKIFMHSPHSQHPGSTQGQYLDINKPITALAAGELDPKSGRDHLFIGTPTNLQAYDVEQNKGLFFKEVPDGVSSIIVGKVGAGDAPLALTGGNCSIQGYDADGKDRFWTVTGDRVSAMAFCDVDSDGLKELVVGTDDCHIITIQNERVISDITETDKITHLAAIQGTRFGYALNNGTVGVYDNATRAWRVKSKHSVGALASFDLDGDGIPEIIIGWSNGRLEVRSDATGDIIFKDMLPSGITAIVQGDYRGDGTDQLIVCGSGGEVRGYLPADPDVTGHALGDGQAAAAALQELTQRRRELLLELQNYEMNSKAASGQQTASRQGGGLVPESTKVDVRLDQDIPGRTCSLVISTNTDAVVRGALLLADQVFEGDRFFYAPRTPEREVRVPLKLQKDLACSLVVKVMVGMRTGTSYQIFEVEKSLPRFCMFAPVGPSGQAPPRSSVTLSLNERTSRLGMWLQTSFCGLASTARSDDLLVAHFVSLRDGSPLSITITASTASQVVISTDDMGLAGDIIQDMAASLGVADLESKALFPGEMAAFEAVLGRVEEANATRLKLTADVADSLMTLKTMVVKAEDARILGSMPAMKQIYGTIQEDLNRGLIMEHVKRSTNHSDLLEALRSVNAMIQRAAQLRVGTPKARVISACRAAVKANNIQSLLRIIQNGSAD